MILVSVCIPVYNMRQYLERCLDSVVQAAKGLDSFEVVIVDDGSDVSCTDIIYKYLAFNNIKLTYIQHVSNKGLLEARRTAIKYANGEYVLMLDCDDILVPGALAKLYCYAAVHFCDVLQGAGIPVTFKDKVPKIREDVNKRFVSSTLKEYEELLDENILDSFMIKSFPTAYICNKLIRREVYVKALNDIPEMYCVLNEDLLQMFFICMHCHKYGFINEVVVKRTLDTGLTNITDKISLDRFRQLCSVNKVYECLMPHAGKYTGIIKNRQHASFNGIKATLNKRIAACDKEKARQILAEYFTVENKNRH